MFQFPGIGERHHVNYQDSHAANQYEIYLTHGGLGGFINNVLGVDRLPILGWPTST